MITTIGPDPSNCTVGFRLFPAGISSLSMWSVSIEAAGRWVVVGGYDVMSVVDDVSLLSLLFSSRPSYLWVLRGSRPKGHCPPVGGSSCPDPTSSGPSERDLRRGEREREVVMIERWREDGREGRRERADMWRVSERGRQGGRGDNGGGHGVSRRRDGMGLVLGSERKKRDISEPSISTCTSSSRTHQIVQQANSPPFSRLSTVNIKLKELLVERERIASGIRSTLTDLLTHSLTRSLPPSFHQ